MLPEAVSCHCIKELSPEVHIPDVLDVGCAGVADAWIAWASHVKRSVVLEASLLDVRCDGSALDSLDSAGNDDLV